MLSQNVFITDTADRRREINGLPFNQKLMKAFPAIHRLQRSFSTAGAARPTGFVGIQISGRPSQSKHPDGCFQGNQKHEIWSGSIKNKKNNGIQSKIEMEKLSRRERER